MVDIGPPTLPLASLRLAALGVGLGGNSAALERALPEHRAKALRAATLRRCLPAALLAAAAGLGLLALMPYPLALQALAAQGLLPLLRALPPLMPVAVGAACTLEEHPALAGQAAAAAAKQAAAQALPEQ
jgi:hypothetical protein